MEQTKKHTKIKAALLVLLVLALIVSNIGWFMLYRMEQNKLKSAIIPTLSEDYFTQQLILTGIAKESQMLGNADVAENIYQGEGTVYPSFPQQADDAAQEEENERIENIYGKILSVPAINQNPKYPNGCEAAAATMLLKYLGYKISLGGFIDTYLKTGPVYEENGLRYGPDPAYFYAGDPSTNRGWGAFEPAVASSLQKFFDMNGKKDSNFVAITNSQKLSLEDMAQSRYFPFIIWTTADYSEADEVYEWKSYDGKHTYTYPKHSHVVVVTGADMDNYYINDSLTGEKNKKIEKDKLSRSFDSMGRQAIHVENVQGFVEYNAAG